MSEDDFSDASSVSSASDYESPPTPPGNEGAFVLPPANTFYYQMDWKPQAPQHPLIVDGVSPVASVPSVACY